MCAGNFAKCLGGTLTLLSVIAFTANILLFFPGGKEVDIHHLSEEVWFFGGILGSGFLMLLPANLFLGLKESDCCGCCGTKQCGNRYAMFASILFAVIGFLGAGYSFAISAFSIQKGPKCLMDNNEWGYPFHNGDYLSDKDLWSKCLEPKNVISWNLILFSILLIVAMMQMLVCAIQVVNGLLGTVCIDCQCCGCCRYATTGCSLTLHHMEKPEHEDICEYHPYSCPCPGAFHTWQRSLEAVMSHLMDAHKSITTLQGEDIVFLATDINLPGAVDWVMMQLCFGHHFMLVLEKQEKYEGHQQFFAIILLISTLKQAENFVYRLELNGNRRRLTWEATPRSIHDGVAAAIMNSNCLVFDTAIAHLFADNGNLGINVTISTRCP